MKPTYTLYWSVTDSLESQSSSSCVDTMNEYVKYMLTTGAGATCANLIIKGVDVFFTISLYIFENNTSPGEQACKSFDFTCGLH